MQCLLKKLRAQNVHSAVTAARRLGGAQGVG